MSRSLGVEVNGLRLALQVDGSPGDPPMLLLHGLGERGRSWSPVSALLAESFQVFTVDLRGHGESSRASVYSFDAMCNDVIGLLEKLQLGPVILVGHSMGGEVAYRVAIARQELLRRLVIEDVSPPYQRDRPIPEPPDETDSLDFDWEVVPAIVREVNTGSQELWDSLNTVMAPTLIIGGGPDSHIPQAKLSEVAASIPRCDLITIAAGHQCILPSRRHSSKPSKVGCRRNSDSHPRRLSISCAART